MEDSQQLRADVIAAVAEVSAAAPATVDEIVAVLGSRYGRVLDTDAGYQVLQQLATDGALDRVDATPAPDGLPVYGFSLPRTGRTVSGRVRRR